MASNRVPWLGLGAAVLLVAASVLLPMLLGWETHARRGDGPDLPPLHGYWEPKLAAATVLALALAVLGWRYAEQVAAVLPWRWLLPVTFVVCLGWLLALALVDGESGLTRVSANPHEYLQTAHEVDDVGALLSEYVDRIPYDAAPDNWTTHVAGHPPVALLFHVALVRLGLGGDLAAGLVITVIAATIPAAVLVCLRALDAERMARRAAPFLVFTPAAVFLAVSADAVFTAVAAWGLACLAVGATASGRPRLIAWSVLAGLLLGSVVMMSYGLPLLGLLALAVLMAARSWLPLPVAAASALAVVLAFAAAGFAWWEAYPVLVERYWDGVASERPGWYWIWGNLGALLLSAGPLIGAGVACVACMAYGLVTRAERAPRPPAAEVEEGALAPVTRPQRPLLLLVGAAVLTVAIADLSQMSRSEVERIWLPFVPWLTLSLALLPAGWRRWGLAAQLATALVVQHLLYTSW